MPEPESGSERHLSREYLRELRKRRYQYSIVALWVVAMLAMPLGRDGGIVITGFLLAAVGTLVLAAAFLSQARRR